ncbi:Uncharacterised protein [Klebsiella aerogenes]|nr:Uncharacterised protein [Klebsiella aerogenes]
MQHNVDFIEGEPVFHQSVKRFKTGARIVAEKIDHLPVTPGAIFRHQMHRYIKVAQGDQRFDPVLSALLEHRTVESDTFRVWLLFITARKQAAPGDRGAEDAKPHLRHQGDILFIAMVKIDRHVAWVEFIFAKRKALLLAQLHRQAMGAVRNSINGRQPFAAFKISAFRLVGGQSAAP